jgi:hypothetical protein
MTAELLNVYESRQGRAAGTTMDTGDTEGYERLARHISAEGVTRPERAA